MMLLLLLAAAPQYVALDSIALRDAADPKGKKVDDLQLGDAVELTGETSKTTSTVKLRCKDVTASWVKVKTAQGKEGWVFGGGLTGKKLEPGPQKWRAVISFMNDPDTGSEDSTFFDQDIRESCEKAKNWFAWASPRQPCAVLGPEKSPVSVVDMTQALKGAMKTNDRWMLIERNGRERSVKVLPYDISTRDTAVEFCAGN